MNKKEIISLWNQTHTDKLKNIDTACAFYMSFEFKAFKSNNIKKRYQVYINRETGVWNNLVEGEEGVLFIGGFSIICISFLVLLNSLGSFEMFTYYIKRKKYEDGTKEIYSDYCKRHDEKGREDRFTFLPYFISGLLLIVASIIIYSVK